MSKNLEVLAVTNQVKISNFREGRAWYTKLLGREPDFMAADNFHEWEIVPGCWLQVAEGHPLQGNGPIRFGVKDIEAVRAMMINELEIEVSEIETIPGVVAWVNFTDPCGNKLGFFQDLSQKEVNRILLGV